MVYAKEIQPEVLLLAATAGILPRSVSITKNFVMLVHDQGVRGYCKEIRLGAVSLTKFAGRSPADNARLEHFRMTLC